MTSHSEEQDQTPEQMLLALKKDMVGVNVLNWTDNLTMNKCAAPNKTSLAV